MKTITYYAYPGIAEQNRPKIKCATVQEAYFRAVKELYRLNKYEIVGTSRLSFINKVRQSGYYILYVHGGLSLKQVGKVFGGKDHSTIHCGKRNVQNAINGYDPALYTVYSAIISHTNKIMAESL